MPNLNVPLSGASVEQFLTDGAISYGWKATVTQQNEDGSTTEIANPMTASEYIQNKWFNDLKSSVRDFRRSRLDTQSIAAIDTELDSIVMS